MIKPIFTNTHWTTTDSFSVIKKWLEEEKLQQNENCYEKDFEKKIEFAGYDKNEISITFENDYLTISAYSSMLNTKYLKKFYLPIKKYDIDSIKAKYEKSILFVKCNLLTKKEEDKKVRTIEIE